MGKENKTKTDQAELAPIEIAKRRELSSAQVEAALEAAIRTPPKTPAPGVDADVQVRPTEFLRYFARKFATNEPLL